MLLLRTRDGFQVRWSRRRSTAMLYGGRQRKINLCVAGSEAVRQYITLPQEYGHDSKLSTLIFITGKITSCLFSDTVDIDRNRKDLPYSFAVWRRHFPYVAMNVTRCSVARLANILVNDHMANWDSMQTIMQASGSVYTAYTLRILVYRPPAFTGAVGSEAIRPLDRLVTPLACFRCMVA